MPLSPSEVKKFHDTFRRKLIDGAYSIAIEKIDKYLRVNNCGNEYRIDIGNITPEIADEVNRQIVSAYKNSGWGYVIIGTLPDKSRYIRLIAEYTGDENATVTE